MGSKNVSDQVEGREEDQNQTFEVTFEVELREFNNQYVGRIFGKDASFIKFSSLEEAEQVNKELQKLRRSLPYFVQPYFVFMKYDSFYLAVEKFQPLVSGNFRPLLASDTDAISAIRDIMNMAVDLDLITLVHGNLTVDTFVTVNGRVKSCAVPLDKSCIRTQEDQIYKIVHRVLVAEGVLPDKELNKFYTRTDAIKYSFMELLKSAKTTMDMESLLLHPFLSDTPARQHYHSSAMIILDTMDKRSAHRMEYKNSYNNRYNEAWPSSINRNSTIPGDMALVRVFDHPMHTGKPKYLADVFEKQIFIRNFFQHAISDAPSVSDFNGLDEVHEHVETTYPDYLVEIFEYLHARGFNGHMGRRNTMLELFMKAQISADFSGQILIAPIVKASKVVAFALAKVKAQCTGYSIPLESLREQILMNVRLIEHLGDQARLEEVEGTPHCRPVVELMRAIETCNCFLKKVFDFTLHANGRATIGSGMSLNDAVFFEIRKSYKGPEKLMKRLVYLGLPIRGKFIRIVGTLSFTNKQLAAFVTFIQTIKLPNLDGYPEEWRIGSTPAH